MDIKELPISIEKVDKIVHIADVHIRNLKRHHEYNQVFERLYEQIRGNVTDNSIIAVLGDVVHAKTEMSPELIRMTSKFLSTLADIQPTVLIPGNHDCFTGDHEVLTNKGWIPLYEYVENDYDFDVAVFDTAESSIKFETPLEHIKKPYAGELISFKGKELDMEVTPTHQVLYQYTTYPDRFYKSNANEVSIKGLIPISSKFDEDMYCDDIWAQILGFSLADGTFVLKNKSTGACRIQFHLKKDREINYLSDILDKYNYEHNINEEKGRSGVYYINIYGELAKNIYEFFGGAKELDWSLLDNDKNFLFNFIKGYLMGDGSNPKNNFWTFVSKYKQNIEILTTAARIVGMNSHTHFHKKLHGGYTGSGELFSGSLSYSFNRNRTSIKEIEKNDFDGYVYCLTVPSGNLFIRRNNKMYITGNCNLNNSYRLDALSPIVDNLKHPNLYYLKDTGVWKVGNLALSHFSVFDDPTEYTSANDIPDDYIKVAMYHGTVDRASTDFGFILTNTEVTVENFRGYDIGLLGDIHKKQYVDLYDNILYCGSLIQQNHGEELEHGFYIWDVENCKAAFHEVENDYGYYTLNIRNGAVPIIPNIPKKPRMRLKISNTDPIKAKRIIADIRKLYNVEELTVNRIDSLNESGINRKGVVDIGDVSSPAYQNDLIIDYIKRNFVVDDSTITRIQNINTNLNLKLDDEELANNVNWKPVRFEFSNMFSYGENNVIDFTDMNGIIGIFGPNASGKSSILDAICFCLFDKSSRAYKSSDILNNKKDEFICKFTFTIDGVVHVIERRAEKEKYGRVPVDVDFYKIVDGTKISLNGEQRRDTNKIIRQYVGEYEDFILTTLSVQNNNTLFIEKSQSERKDLLAQFIGIDVFDKLYTLANEQSRDIQTLLKDFENQDFSTKLADVEKQYEEDQQLYNQYKKQKKDLVSKKQAMVNTIMDLNKKMVDVPNKKLDIDHLENQKASIEKNIASISEQMKLAKIKVREKKHAKRALDTLIKDIDVDQVESDYESYKNKLSKIRDLERDRKYLEKSIKKHKKTESHLLGLEFDPDCEFCVRRNEHDANQLKSIKNSITEEQSELDTISEEISILEESIDEKIESRWKKLNEVLDRIDNQKGQISEYELKVSRLEVKLQGANSKLKSIADDIRLYNKIKDDIRHNKNIQLEVNSVQSELRTVESQIDSIESKMRDVHGKFKVAENKKKDIQKKLNKLQDLSDNYKAYEYYMNAIKRDGVPYELISKSMPGIEEEVNNILSQMVDFGVMLDVDGKNINARLVYDEDKIWPLEMGSGMEKFIASLAIRTSLVNISNLPRPNFLAVDEGFGSLDSENVSSIFMMFDYLKANFDFVMIISHLDVMRDVVNDLVTIQDKNGFSNVVYQ